MFEIYVSVVFVIRCLYSAVSLTLVREQRFIRIIIIIIIIINIIIIFKQTTAKKVSSTHATRWNSDSTHEHNYLTGREMSTVL